MGKFFYLSLDKVFGDIVRVSNRANLSSYTCEKCSAKVTGKCGLSVSCCGSEMKQYEVFAGVRQGVPEGSIMSVFIFSYLIGGHISKWTDLYKTAKRHESELDYLGFGEGILRPQTFRETFTKVADKHHFVSLLHTFSLELKKSYPQIKEVNIERFSIESANLSPRLYAFIAMRIWSEENPELRKLAFDALALSQQFKHAGLRVLG